jgi:hypothetical protein
MSPKVIVNSFVKRQTPESPFSHYSGTWGQLEELVKQNLHKAKPGYRDGVLLTPVPAEGFYSGVISLKEGHKMEATFVARRPGEKPRKRVTAKGDKMPAASVEVVTYSSELLGEDAETTDGTEIISINASTTMEPTPMAPGTMMANHFEADGGTSTNMSPEEFEKDLRKSFNYWKDKALCGGD